MKLWYTKHLHRMVIKWIGIKEKAEYWIGYYTKRRQEYLNKLDTTEFMRFAADTGYIPAKWKGKNKKRGVN